MSLGMFVFFLSVGANIFFLATRAASLSVQQCAIGTEFEEQSLLMPPRTFGRVLRGFPVKTVSASGTSALLPVSSYVVPPKFIPSLTGELPLFRDQGVPLEEAEVQRIFDRLGVTLDWQNLRLLPILQRWRSADRTIEIALDIEKRSLTVTRLGSFGPSDDGRADDLHVLAIAREFAVTLGIDVSVFGKPQIVERVTEEGGSSRTYVVWPMLFQNVPLLDPDTKPVPGLQIQVGRLSGKALSMTVTLLKPDRMTLSAYPSTSKEAAQASLAIGGLLPIAADLAGEKTDVVYTAIKPSYVLLLGDREYPTYIIPTLLAEYRQGSVSGTTFVPALSAEHFLWSRIIKNGVIAPAPMVPASLSGAARTGSGAQ